MLCAEVAWLYFLVHSAVLRYNFVHVFAQEYESGGEFFPMLFNQAMAALLISMVALLEGVQPCYSGGPPRGGGSNACQEKWNPVSSMLRRC